MSSGGFFVVLISIARRRVLWTAASHRRFARLRKLAVGTNLPWLIRVHAVPGLGGRDSGTDAPTQSGEARALHRSPKLPVGAAGALDCGETSPLCTA